MAHLKTLVLTSLATGLLLSGCGGAKEDTATKTKAEEQAAVVVSPIDYALAGAWRGKQADRDMYRHPKETLAFLGFDPSQNVVEIFPGGGWYTNVLAPAIQKGGGTYTAALFEEALGEFYVKNNAKFAVKFADKEIYGDIVTSHFGPTSGPIASGTADMVLTFRSVHNWMGKGYAGKGFTDFYAALKPGGILGVVEHRLPESREQDMKGGSGYVQISYVKKLAEEAGFEFVGASDINANPKDTADHPYGVWTLPPVSRTPDDAPGDFNPAKYKAIGESDRFTLKFRKPE